MTGYEHTQHSPLWLALMLPAIAGLLAAAFADDAALRLAATGFASIFALLAACFRTLTVRDRGEYLDVRFGPLPWFGTRLCYADVQRVERTRSRLIDGWGVHWIPGRGRTFNLWGFDCVEVTTAKGVVRIGTDDADALARLLAARLQAGEAPGS